MNGQLIITPDVTGVLPAKTPPDKLPLRVSHRAGMMPVRDQLQSGACVAFAVAAVAEFFAMKLHGIQYRLSPQFLYDLRKLSTPGMLVQDGGAVCTAHGVCPEVDGPFSVDKPESLPTKFTDHVNARAKPFMSLSYYYVQTAPAARVIAEAKACLNDIGPVIMSAMIYSPCAEDGQFWKPSTTEPSQKIGCHAFVVDGYDEEGFHIRNSWGPLWNDDGHTHMPYEDVGAVMSLLVLNPNPQAAKPLIVPTTNAFCGNTEQGAFQKCVDGLLCCSGQCSQAASKPCDFWQQFSDGTPVVPAPLPALEPAQQPRSWKPIIIGVSVAAGVMVLVFLVYLFRPRGRAYHRLSKH